MKFHHEDIKIKTIQNRVSYHDISQNAKDIVKRSKIKNGIITLTSSHTTCSLYFEEYMHDKNYYGDEFLQIDISNIMDKIVPRCTTENQYYSPGVKHIEFGLGLTDPNYPAEAWTMLNTDAHIKSSIFGTNSQTIIVKDGEMQLGSLGKIYFADWDILRERNRTVNVLVMGL